MSLHKKTLNKLIKKNISISTAESCTGGLLASSITKIKDASKTYLGGYITYSNEFKNFIHQKIAETFYPLIENKMIESFKKRADSLLD